MMHTRARLGCVAALRTLCVAAPAQAAWTWWSFNNIVGPRGAIRR